MTLQFPLNLTQAGNQALSELAETLPSETSYDNIINALLILAANDPQIYQRLSLDQQKQALIHKRTQQFNEGHQEYDSSFQQLNITNDRDQLAEERRSLLASTQAETEPEQLEQLRFSVDATLYFRSRTDSFDLKDFEIISSVASQVCFSNPDEGCGRLDEETLYLDFTVESNADSFLLAEEEVQRQLPLVVKLPTGLVLERITVQGTYNNLNQSWESQY